MSTLVIVDATASGAHKHAAKVIAAASALGGEIALFVFGAHASEASAMLNAQPVVSITTYSPGTVECFSAEQLTALILEYFSGYGHYLTAANSTGKDFLPRLALKLDVQPVTDVVEILSPEEFTRPMYAGNVLVRVRDSQPVKCLTVRPTSFDALADGEQTASLHALDAALPAALVDYEPQMAEADGVVDITSANVVVAAGSGIGGSEAFANVERLAAKLGAGVGASRALVDAGVALNECQVGQTGKVVAPELYIALGISGAVQHIAGMKDSGTIVAVNTDASAPIVAVSDYVLIADLNEVMPKLLEAF